jgi:hypothetical protein
LASGTTGARQFERQTAGLQPTVSLAKAGVANIGRQVRKAPPCFRIIQKLHVPESPFTLRLNEGHLLASTLLGSRDEQISLVAQTQIHPLMEFIEEANAFANQLDLFGIVKLQPKGAGGYRCRKRREGGTLLQDNRVKSGAFREVGSGTPDDAAADDDQIGAVGR